MHEELYALCNCQYLGLPSYKYSHLVKLLLVSYSNACLRLFVVILQDLHCLQISLIIGALHFTSIQISTVSGAFVSEIRYCLPEAIFCYITRFTLFT